MSFVRSAVQQVLGLFVGDWLQSLVVLAIIAAGYFAVSRFGAPALVVVVLLLAGQLVWFAAIEGRKASARP